jgi:hypothetical protein
MPKADPINTGHTFVPAYNEGTKYHYLPLAGEYVTLEAKNQVAVINPKLVPNTSGTLPCPDASSHTSLRWLSSIKEIRGGTPVKEDKYFKPWPLTTNVLGRAILQYGRLDAHVIKPGVIWGFGKPVQIGFPTLGNEQALAEEVHWTFEAQEEPFVLSLVGFDGISRRVAFKPNAGKLLIFIANTPHKDTGPVSPTAEAIDKHYSVYHTLAKGNPRGLGRIPHDSTRRCTQSAAYLFDPTLTPTTSSVAPGAAAYSSTPVAGTSAITSTQPVPSGLNCSGTRWP